MAKKKELPMMITASKVKAYVAENGGDVSRSAGDLVPELNKKVASLLDDAMKRCGTNNRGTVRAGDL